MGRAGAPWRRLPHDFPPWPAVSQQTPRWLAAGVFEEFVHDRRAVLRLAAGRPPEPRAMILDSRTRQSSVESGARAGSDGHKRKKGRKLPVAVDTLGHLLALVGTPANEQDRTQRAAVAERAQAVTGQRIELAVVDQGYTGKEPAQAAAVQGIQLEVVKLPEAKRGFVRRPRRWVVERSFAWVSRCRRLARDYERLPETVNGWHCVAFACLRLSRAMLVFAGSS